MEPIVTPPQSQPVVSPAQTQATPVIAITNPTPFVPEPPKEPLVKTEEVIVEKIPGGYSWTRHVLLVVLILLAIIIIASLIYLNGKSIYQYGV